MSKSEKIKILENIKKYIESNLKSTSNKTITAERENLAREYCKKYDINFYIAENCGANAMKIRNTPRTEPALYLRCGYGRYNYAPALIIN